jgi:mono/diheme cytochrome c family protein
VKHWILMTAALALPLAAAPARAVEAEGVALGRDLVATYCADCHAIEKTGESTHPEAPPLRDLHLRYELEWLSEALVEGLVSGHADMPEFEFDPQQAEAIVGYLESLSQ